MDDFYVIDTHLHLWDTGNLRYPWLDGEPAINRPHLLDEYAEATIGLPVERMIFLQCEVDSSQYLDEARWVADQAELDPRIEGIVPWAPLEQGEDAREALEKLTHDPLVKGIRRIIQFESDPAFCLRPEFVHGVQLLAEFDLHFEICIKGEEQFTNTLELVRRCPGVRFILDHIGKPFIKEGLMEPWASQIRELAALPNTWCKISGLVNEADWETWTVDELRPYVEHVLDAFTFQRCCYGGDWPVCTLAGSYVDWFGALAKIVGGSGVENITALFNGTAIDFYRLEP